MLGVMMKETREDKDLTQNELSDIIGVARSTYAGWENGIDTIPLSRLNDLCNYFDISLDYMCGISKNKQYKNEILNKISKTTIGKKLKYIRMKNGDTQMKVANKIHTEQSNYSRYERGITLISTSLIMSFSKNYEVSLDYLCGKKKEPDII